MLERELMMSRISAVLWVLGASLGAVGIALSTQSGAHTPGSPVLAQAGPTDVAPTNTSTPASEPTATPTPVISVESTNTPTPVVGGTEPTATPTPAGTATATPTGTQTATPTATPSPTSTPTPEVTSEATVEPDKPTATAATRTPVPPIVGNSPAGNAATGQVMVLGALGAMLAAGFLMWRSSRR